MSAPISGRTRASCALRLKRGNHFVEPIAQRELAQVPGACAEVIPHLDQGGLVGGLGPIVDKENRQVGEIVQGLRPLHDRSATRVERLPNAMRIDAAAAWCEAKRMTA